MKQIAILAICGGFFLWLCPAGASAQTTAEMRMQARQELADADAELNKVYQELLKKRAGDKVFVGNLKEAQRAWLAFVESHIKTVYPLKEGENPGMVYGSMYAIDYAMTKTELVKERVKQLKFLLSNEEDR